MEQKRTLWIVAAAGVFLLVVIGAALILSAPKNEPARTLYNPGEGWASTQEWTNNQKVADISPIEVLPSTTAQPQTSEQTQPLAQATEDSKTAINHSAPLKVENVTVIADNTLVYGTGTTTTIDLNTLKSNPPQDYAVSPKNDYTANRMNEVQETQASKSAQTQYKSAPDSYYAPPPKVKETTQTVTKTQPKTSVAQSTKKAVSTKTATPAKTAEPAKPDTYWIQVGSYEAKKSADEARAMLDKNKIQNEVFTYKDSKGKLFYRVRVGPYTTKSEAEYWQKRILATDEFAKTKSYVVKN